MAEAETQVSKSKTEYTPVVMSDGRTVQFAGKKKVLKETLLDPTKIEVDEKSGLVQFGAGAVSIRMDFRDGSTRTIAAPLSLLGKFAGHGMEQKFGDELASPADKPLSPEDMVIAIDDLDAEIQKGNWGKGRAEGGGGVSGASIVVKAILEVMNEGRPANGKTVLSVEDIKAFLQKKLDASKASDGESALSRRALYDSFRAEGTKTAAVIKRMEAEKATKAPKVDADALMATMEA